MAGSNAIVKSRDGVPELLVLWQTGAVVCTCSHPAFNQIEITLTVNRTRVEQVVFQDSQAAAVYAIKKMQAYLAN